MKKTTLIAIIFIMANLNLHGQVAINNTNSAPNTYAMLDVSGAQKGILIPRITTADRTNMAGSMSTTEEGLTVYDTDTKSFWFWDGTTWIAVGNGAMQEDKDWYKEGTTNAPTDINDKMFHLGQVAIGKNTTSAPLDVYTDSALYASKVENANTDTSQSLRVAHYVNMEGTTSVTSYGKLGYFARLGGDAGGNGNSYAALTGMEVDIKQADGANKYQYGYVTDISGANDKDDVGLNNYMHDSSGAGARYGVLNYITGTSTGNVYSHYTFIGNNGDGIHFGNYYRIGGNGNGVQYGAFNRIFNSGTGKQIGVVNEIKTAGASAHVGTFNALGAGVTEANPSNLVPITNDSDGKRVGTINTIAGNGGGIHVGASNVIFSTGDGFHLGNGNVLGYDPVNNVPTATGGYQLGSINNITDLGNAIHVGEANVLGFVFNPNDPTHPTPLQNDSDADRFGQVNTLGADGDGLQIGVTNVILNTGSGIHVGSNNVLGYDYVNNTGTATAGKMYGTVNNIPDTGTGEHIGISNVLGIITPGVPVNGDSNAKRTGIENIIGGDGNGTHYGAVNIISSTGDGTHIASLNKVGSDGAGRHIAVYGEVDAADVTAMAGVFKGYTTSGNQVSTISLYNGNEYNVTNTSMEDLWYAEAGFDPTIYSKTGVLEVKVVIKTTASGPTGNEFQLRAENMIAGSTTVISTADTWTWTETSTGKHIVTSQWKQWVAGTDLWELHLQGKTGSSLKFDNVYILVRPAQP